MYFINNLKKHLKKLSFIVTLSLSGCLLISGSVLAEGLYQKVDVTYSYTPPAPKTQTPEQALVKSTG
ncbi:MAG: hypothetical protein ACI9UT_001831, partial [Flavobacteriales bacterium]